MTISDAAKKAAEVIECDCVEAETRFGMGGATVKFDREQAEKILQTAINAETKELRAAIKKFRDLLKDVADNAYCTGVTQAMHYSPILGAKAKIETGVFTEEMLECHRLHAALMAKHTHYYEVMRILDITIPGAEEVTQSTPIISDRTLLLTQFRDRVLNGTTENTVAWIDEQMGGGE